MKTPRERVIAVLEKRPVDRIPVDIWYTDEVLAYLKEFSGASDPLSVFRRLGIDKIVWFSQIYKGPTRKPRVEDEVTDHWGGLRRRVQAGPAVYEELADYPLLGYETLESLDDYPWWPDPEEYDYDKMWRKTVDAVSEFAVMAPWVSVFETYCWMRGLEQSLMDLYVNPGFVQAALDRIEGIQTEMLKRFLAGAPCKPDLVLVSDDMGGQENLLISLDTWMEFFGPRLKRWCDLIHSFGVRVFYHSDGAVEPLIPYLIEAGIDVLNPIQHACAGMDMRDLKKKYGDRLIFHGGVDNQRVLPFGTPEDVRRETLDCLEALGRGGGYICCSCHNIQARTPVENILSMIETIRSG
jgi:uroporphyrinogen decarboxylase